MELSKLPPLTHPAAFPRSFRKVYPAAVRGEGVYLWDADGLRFLDFSGSAAVNFIGHGVREIGAAMAAQTDQLEFVHSSQFTTPAAEAFAAELLDFAGPHFAGGCVYFCSGGSEAVETALKLARQYQVEIGHPERVAVLSRTQSYHGSTLGALAASGNRRRREMYLPMVREFAHIGVPHCYRCQYSCALGCDDCGLKYANELERAILEAGAGAPNAAAAGFLCEPVSGATLGASVPPQSYLQRIREICSLHGLLMIADEVMTGMGRTGRNFAFHHCGHACGIPDILVTAKGLSSGYAPLGAVIASAKVVDAIANGSGAFLHGFTYNAHPVSVAAGRAVLRIMREEDLVARANSDSGEAGGAMKSTLQQLWQLAAVGDVRGIGLLWGVEFVADRTSKRPFAPAANFAPRVGAAAARRGLLVYPMQGSVDGNAGDHLLLAPPAVITPEQVNWAVQQLAEAIEEVAGEKEP